MFYTFFAMEFRIWSYLTEPHRRSVRFGVSMYRKLVRVSRNIIVIFDLLSCQYLIHDSSIVKDRSSETKT